MKNTVILASSYARGWSGVDIDLCHGVDGCIDGVAPLGHLAMLNLEKHPITLDSGYGRNKLSLRPGGLLLLPAGTPLSLYHRGTCTVITAQLTTQYFAQTLGNSVRLEVKDDFVDERIAIVMRSLVAEARRDMSRDTSYIDSLGISLASLLSAHASSVDSLPPAPLTRLELKRISDRVEAFLGDKLYVADLASEVGMSTAHFARAFKRATSETPHRYLMRRRVEIARDRLAAGEPIADTAIACGFADQAHLSRWFKHIVGATPREFARRVQTTDVSLAVASARRGAV
jgi:AraC family transcriptional regulator